MWRFRDLRLAAITTSLNHHITKRTSAISSDSPRQGGIERFRLLFCGPRRDPHKRIAGLALDDRSHQHLTARHENERLTDAAFRKVVVALRSHLRKYQFDRRLIAHDVFD